MTRLEHAGDEVAGPKRRNRVSSFVPLVCFFFTSSCLISSPKLETRVSSCFFIFFFLLYHHETRRRRVSCIFFQVLPQGLETRVSSSFFLIFLITTDKFLTDELHYERTTEGMQEKKRSNKGCPRRVAVTRLGRYFIFLI